MLTEGDQLTLKWHSKSYAGSITSKGRIKYNDVILDNPSAWLCHILGFWIDKSGWQVARLDKTGKTLDKIKDEYLKKYGMRQQQQEQPITSANITQPQQQPITNMKVTQTQPMTIEEIEESKWIEQILELTRSIKMRLALGPPRPAMSLEQIKASLGGGV
jgi:hypothetical protein